MPTYCANASTDGGVSRCLIDVGAGRQRPAAATALRNVSPDELDVIDLAGCQGEILWLAARAGGCARRRGPAADHRVHARRQLDLEVPGFADMLHEDQR